MNKKIFLSLLVISLFIISVCSYSFAANDNMMDNARNAVMSAGNSIGNAAVTAKNAIVNGAQDITNGAGTLGKDAMNTAGTMGNDAGDISSRTDADSATGVIGNGDDDYTATRTATTTDSNLLGMSTATWTWLILGIVGIIIVALVWYYGAQYEHKNYNE